MTKELEELEEKLTLAEDNLRLKAENTQLQTDISQWRNGHNTLSTQNSKLKKNKKYLGAICAGVSALLVGGAFFSYIMFSKPNYDENEVCASHISKYQSKKEFSDNLEKVSLIISNKLGECSTALSSCRREPNLVKSKNVPLKNKKTSLTDLMETDKTEVGSDGDNNQPFEPKKERGDCGPALLVDNYFSNYDSFYNDFYKDTYKVSPLLFAIKINPRIQKNKEHSFDSIQIKKMLVHIDDCIKDGYSFPYLYLNKGQLFFFNNDVGDAIGTFSNGLKLFPEDPDLYLARGISKFDGVAEYHSIKTNLTSLNGAKSDIKKAVTLYEKELEKYKVSQTENELHFMGQSSLEKLAYSHFYLGKVKEELGDETAAQHFKFAKDNGLELK